MDSQDQQDMREALAEMQQLYGADSPEFLAFVENLSTGGNVFEKKYEPVPIKQFIEDPYFMGNILGEIWPNVISSVTDVINGKYEEAIFDGCLGRGKTTRATIVCAYHLYVLSCYVSPQKVLGLMPNSDLYIAMLNKTMELAERVTYAKFRKLIETIPYFRENFQHDDNIKSEMRFPNGIFVIASNADNDKLMGIDLVTILIDEINFYAVTEKSKRTHNKSTYNQALTIYNGVKARIASRFEGIDIGIKGCMCVVSSRAYKDDFTGTKIKEIAQRKKDGLPETIYLSTGSFWSFAPQYRKDGSQRFADDTFLLAIGSDRLKSEIIDDISEAHGREVIDVPVNYRKNFEEDIERNIRDLAGTVSGVTGSYFTNPEIVWAATDPFVAKFERIFTQEEWDLSLGLPDINPNYRLYHPLTPRFIHLDLSLTGDNTGIGIAHSITDEKVRTSRLQPSTDFEKAPIIIYDDFLAINPPEVGEISYASIRKLLYYLMDVVGLKIKWVSADTYNSNDMLQILAEKRGIETTKLSVEKEEPYLAVKNAYNEERVILAPHEMAINELLTVILDDKGNIDHTAKGCFVGDTEVLLSSGDKIRFVDMKDKYYEIMTFDGGKFKPSLCINQGITKYVNSLVEIQLDNDEVIRCTPEHKILLSSGNWIEARDLTDEDDILSLP